jgi:hypothetical protein
MFTQLHPFIAALMVLAAVLMIGGAVIRARKSSKGRTSPFFCPILILFTVIASPGVSSAGSITYFLTTDPVAYNGWLLGGSITTDGTIGNLSDDNITSWNWGILKGTTGFAISSGAPGVPGGFVHLVGTVTATANEITLPPATGKNKNVLFLFFGNLGLIADVGWAQYGPDKTANSFVDSQYVVPALVGVPAWNTPTNTLNGQTTWVIATNSIPEPSTLHLAVTGFVCSVLYATTRQVLARRRERKKGPGAVSNFRFPTRMALP